MRNELLNLIRNTILYRYDLPHIEKDISNSVFSTENDKCYETSDINSLSEIIYNSIIEYSLSNLDFEKNEFEKLHAIALKTKLKYNELSSETIKISHGFHGETVLFCILYAILNSKPAISRGYFYNPLESSETKGYDSYHLIENNGTTELWFGEVKFRTTHSSGIKSALDSIEKAISDDYLASNFLAMTNFKNSFNIEGTKIEEIIRNWEDNPVVDIIEEIKKHNLKLIYPIVILYNKSSDGYDKSIKNAISYIEERYSSLNFKLSIPYSIYFIWIPVEDVRQIKLNVIEWIESKKPLMS
ncbi:Hachiman antiphage defense system protein HamA [Tenacibaculum caenipelagi]|uniref:Uncharacterized protein DUF1837 n=1 Tax=Tenacibaculum caenipelagi TaxID=1325435 RepID=A0A4R6TGC9_9FLAO|nr:Hachiman antiphage defense system protein HamA [Tenacibaculum caenipelagi]TDQ24012.1 uncharacterized protein DUF1837 [Tenacibaculum caenipelagi]